MVEKNHSSLTIGSKQCLCLCRSIICCVDLSHMFRVFRYFSPTTNVFLWDNQNSARQYSLFGGCITSPKKSCFLRLNSFHAGRGSCNLRSCHPSWMTSMSFFMASRSALGFFVFFFLKNQLVWCRSEPSKKKNLTVFPMDILS